MTVRSILRRMWQPTFAPPSPWRHVLDEAERDAPTPESQKFVRSLKRWEDRLWWIGVLCGLVAATLVLAVVINTVAGGISRG